MDEEVLARLRKKADTGPREDHEDLSDAEFREVWGTVNCTDLTALLASYDAATDEVEAWRHFYGDPATGAINRQIGGIKSKLKETRDELAEARAEILHLHIESAPPCEHPEPASLVCGCPPCGRCGHQPHHHPYLPSSPHHSSCTLIGCTCQVYQPAPTLGVVTKQQDGDS